MNKLLFIIESILLGIGLAMDAFSLSVSNGIKYPKMHKWEIIKIAMFFGIFQCLMVLIGFFFGYTIVNIFTFLKEFVKYFASIVILYIAIKLIFDGVTGKENEDFNDSDIIGASTKTLVVEAVATSMDALFVGFSMSNFIILKATIASLIIGIVTFVLCFMGVHIGIIFGNAFKKQALICGGIILTIIAVRILFSV